MDPLLTPSNLEPNGQSLQLSKEQKIGLAFLAFFTLLIIVFWFLELNKNITYPFYGGVSKNSFEAKVNSELLAQEQLTASTADRDTDGDGLTDTQELTIYKTSPFLNDTDGDGVLDGAEIKNSTNPNCPEGKQCSIDGMVVGTEQINSRATSSFDLFNPGSATNNTAIPINSTPVQALDSGSVETLKQAFGEKPDPKFLRDQLIQAATKEEDKEAFRVISDADLLTMYNSMIGQ